MCGICGILQKNEAGIDRKILQHMCDVMYHRGPDDEGFFVKGCIGLGMRRLSIIDLTGGKQPIHNEERTIWVIFNGEIYNFLILRDELVKSGHTFYTKTDTEVIVHLYEEYGIHCVKKLRGMFAFALWDDVDKKLLIARDRVGIKPLYYYQDDKTLIFGSEIKSILKHPKVDRELDLNSLDSYLSYLYIPAPRSIFKNIKKLPAGHIMIVENSEVSLRQYWDIDYRVNRQLSLEDFKELFLDKFREAVKLRLVSDVPLGVLLSGGVDSSAIVAIMSELSTRPVETFTIGYGEKNAEFDETRYAEIIANKFKTNHHLKLIEPKNVDIIPSIVTFFDEPFADSSAFPNYFVCQLARENVTVALSGLGGDEICAGYNRYTALLYSKYFDKIPRILREKLMINLVNMLPDSQKGNRFSERIKKFVNNGLLPIDMRYLGYITFLTESQKRDIYSTYFLSQVAGEYQEQFEGYFHQFPQIDLLNRALFADLKLYLPDDLLTLTDRMSMAHSLEVRVPFLDHELLELMATIPPEYKMHHTSKKYFLKKSFGGILPKEILYRRKQGFSIPLGMWFRTSLKEYIVQNLSPQRIKSLGLFRYEKIREMMSEHFEKKENYNLQLWAILMFLTWHDLYLENK